MDISKLSVNELEDLRAKLPREIEKRKMEQKEKALSEVQQAAAKYGFTVEELITGRRHSVNKVAKGASKPVAVKYRHPKQAELAWTGRGRKPAWVSDWLTQGNSLDELRV